VFPTFQDFGSHIEILLRKYIIGFIFHYLQVLMPSTLICKLLIKRCFAGSVHIVVFSIIII
jgi:hypothetical protein